MFGSCRCFDKKFKRSITFAKIHLPDSAKWRPSSNRWIFEILLLLTIIKLFLQHRKEIFWFSSSKNDTAILFYVHSLTQKLSIFHATYILQQFSLYLLDFQLYLIYLVLCFTMTTLTLFGMELFGTAHGCGGLPPLKSLTHILQW